MKWSWKILRIAGIDVYIHATFPIFLIWIGMAYWNMGQTWQAVFSGVSFVLILFGCVVLHEFGHALTARRYGFKTLRITLLPIGGVASFETLPEDPKQEMIVALAGPAVNVVIALGLWFWIRLNDLPLNIEQLNLENGFSLGALMMVNISLVLFNMLPAFPMDGGRVFRALLAFRMNRRDATLIAAKTGQALALGLGFLGVLFNPFLVIIALFIWMGATSESSLENLKSLLSGKKAQHAMLTNYAALTPTDTLARAVELTLAGAQTEFPVIDHGKIISLLTQADLLKGLHEHGTSVRVSEYAQGDIFQCESGAPLETVIELMLKNRSGVIAVTDEKTLVGIIDFRNIMEFINFRTALRPH